MKTAVFLTLALALSAAPLTPAAAQAPVQVFGEIDYGSAIWSPSDPLGLSALSNAVGLASAAYGPANPPPGYSGLASTSYVAAAVSPLASTQALALAVAPLASKQQVAQAIASIPPASSDALRLTTPDATQWIDGTGGVWRVETAVTTSLLHYAWSMSGVRAFGAPTPVPQFNQTTSDLPDFQMGPNWTLHIDEANIGDELAVALTYSGEGGPVTWSIGAYGWQGWPATLHPDLSGNGEGVAVVTPAFTYVPSISTNLVDALATTSGVSLAVSAATNALAQQAADTFLATSANGGEWGVGWDGAGGLVLEGTWLSAPVIHTRLINTDIIGLGLLEVGNATEGVRIGEWSFFGDNLYDDAGFLTCGDVTAHNSITLGDVTLTAWPESAPKLDRTSGTATNLTVVGTLTVNGEPVGPCPVWQSMGLMPNAGGIQYPTITQLGIDMAYSATNLWFVIPHPAPRSHIVIQLQAFGTTTAASTNPVSLAVTSGGGYGAMTSPGATQTTICNPETLSGLRSTNIVYIAPTPEDTTRGGAFLRFDLFRPNTLASGNGVTFLSPFWRCATSNEIATKTFAQ